MWKTRTGPGGSEERELAKRYEHGDEHCANFAAAKLEINAGVGVADRGRFFLGGALVARRRPDVTAFGALVMAGNGIMLYVPM